MVNAKRFTEITDITRDNLVIDFSHVKTKRESNRYCYYFPDLLKSVIFRLSLIKNYKKLSKLDFDGRKFELTDEIKRGLKRYKYEDRFWLEEIHLRSFQDRFVEKYVNVLSQIYRDIVSFNDTYVDSAQKLVTLKTNYDHFLMD